MSGIFQDVKFALRQCGARPLFTAATIATIALGIGANAAIFSVVNGLMLHPLPYEGADRLASLWRSSGTTEMLVTPDGELIDRWRTASSFEAIEAWSTGAAVVRTTSGSRALRRGSFSAGFPAMIRMPPLLGRAFAPDDEAESAERVVLLSHPFWRAEFGGDPGAVGRPLTIDGVPHTVVGVTPAGFVLPDIDVAGEPDVWLPLRRGADGPYLERGIRAMGRLADGVSRARAEAELSAISAREAEDVGDTDFRGVRLTQPADMLGAGVQRSLLLLLGAVAFVLVIACANVANLLLVRASARSTELSVRVMLGASRGRLFRQLLVESLLIGIAGGALGTMLAFWGIDLIVAIRPDSLRELERIRIDARVIAYAASLTMLTSVLFGLVPALRASRAATVRTSSRTVTGGNRRIAGALIVAEVALSLILVVGAGLLVRTLVSLQARPIGFEPDGLWAVDVEWPGTDEKEQRAASFERVRELAADLPGVRAAELISAMPPNYGISFGALALDGAPPQDDSPTIFATNFVSPAFFETIGMQFVDGRAFTDADGDEVVVVGAAFARRFFDGSAVGHRIRIGADGAWHTIVGVAADLPAHGLARTANAFDQIHFPAGRRPLETLLVSSDLTADALVPALRGVVARVDPGAALGEVHSATDLLAGSLSRQRFNLTLLLMLAGLATLLSAIGLYGVVSVAVAGRTREIGIRRALGASDAGILRLALGEGMVPALIGLGVGLVASFGLTRLMTSLLYGLSPHDPLTLATVPAGLALIALLASWLPGRRAARIEPVEALRIET